MKGKRGPRPSSRKAKPVKRARQTKLPGMEDDKIDALENLALDYAGFRDQRQQLTAQEVPAKQKLIAEMKNLGRMTYKRDGISITRTVEKEGVTVRVKKAKPDDD